MFFCEPANLEEISASTWNFARAAKFSPICKVSVQTTKPEKVKNFLQHVGAQV